MGALSALFRYIQHSLFPLLDKTLDEPLTEKQREFVRVAELTELEKHVGSYRWLGFGRPRAKRLSLALAFVAKAVYNLPTTKALVEWLGDSANLRRLCGWERASDVPSEATFSRAFAEFARGRLPEKVHKAMIQQNIGPKLMGHASLDATAIDGREKPAAKPTPPAPDPSSPPRRRGRPRRGETRAPKPPRRLELQPGRPLADNVADLPTACDIGTKRNAKGHAFHWIGYKLHLSVVDGDIPIGALLTSASTHDSQAAIPLLQMNAGRVTNLYDLGDAAYDASEILAFSRSLGHVPIIDRNARGGAAAPPMDPATAVRYGERTADERVNSDLKDNHGGRFVRVRGAAKVMTHLMFGVLVIAAKQLFALLE